MIVDCNPQIVNLYKNAFFQSVINTSHVQNVGIKTSFLDKSKKVLRIGEGCRVFVGKRVIQVRAGAEAPARAGDDQYPDGIILWKADEQIVELIEHLQVDRIELLRPVQGD